MPQKNGGIVIVDEVVYCTMYSVRPAHNFCFRNPILRNDSLKFLLVSLFGISKHYL